ncbi:MAG: 2-C-methyl-D-erythritol 4-phosphate cytidylyltransferase [Lachnospira sp.]
MGVNTAIILSGGSGKRMNSNVPKQYLTIRNKPVLYYSIKAFERCDFIDEIIIVAAEEYIDYVSKEIVDKYNISKVTGIVSGGKERYDSVYEGLKNKTGHGIVFIHDGARPCITGKVLMDCYEAALNGKSNVAAVPVKDTIKIADAGNVAISTPDRKTLWQVQTPQVFSYDIIKKAYDTMYETGNTAGITDDAMVAERFTGEKIYLTEADYKNIKITTPEDMVLAEAFLKACDE